MLSESLLGIEELIVRTPGLLARLASPPVSNYELAKSRKMHWDHFDDDVNGDGLPDRPFFVLKESDLNYHIENAETLEGIAAVDVYYTEAATNQADHKLSKKYFLDFVSDMLDSIAARQGQLIDGLSQDTYITVHHITMTQFATRSMPSRVDPDRTQSDYWWCAWRMFVGGGPGGLG